MCGRAHTVGLRQPRLHLGTWIWGFPTTSGRRGSLGLSCLQTPASPWESNWVSARQGAHMTTLLGKSLGAGCVASFLGCSILGESARDASGSSCLVSQTLPHTASFADFAVRPVAAARHRVGVALSEPPMSSQRLLQPHPEVVAVTGTGFVTAACVVLLDEPDRRKGPPVSPCGPPWGPGALGPAGHPGARGDGRAAFVAVVFAVSWLQSGLCGGRGGVRGALCVLPQGWDADSDAEVTWAPEHSRGVGGAQAAAVWVWSARGARPVRAEGAAPPEAWAGRPASRTGARCSALGCPAVSQFPLPLPTIGWEGGISSSCPALGGEWGRAGTQDSLRGGDSNMGGRGETHSWNLGGQPACSVSTPGSPRGPFLLQPLPPAPG